MRELIREKDLNSVVVSCRRTSGGVCKWELLMLRKKRQVEWARHQLLVDQYQVLCVTNQSGGTHPPGEPNVSSKQRRLSEYGYSPTTRNTKPGRDGCHDQTASAYYSTHWGPETNVCHKINNPLFDVNFD